MADLIDVVRSRTFAVLRGVAAAIESSARDMPTTGTEMGADWVILVLPMLLGLPVACVGLILRLCEWSWKKPPGSMGSTAILAGYGVVCAVNLLLAGLAVICFGAG